MAGIINQGSHPKALWPGVYSMFGMSYNNRDQWRDLVDVQTSDKHREEMVQNNGFGLAAVKEQGESVGYDTTSQGGTAIAQHITYALGYIITREAIEDNLYEKLAMGRAKALKRSMIETKNTVVANWFNRGFDTNYPVGPDAKPIFSASHPSSSGNQSNLLSTAADLSEASLEDLVIQANGATDDRGNKIALQVLSLHIPRQLEFDAARILKSINQNDSANNAINAMRALGTFPEGFKVNNFFTDTDAFFIKTDVSDGLTLFQRRELEFTKDNEFGTENALAKATERYSVQIGDFRNYYGSAGA
ncbi:MAG: hypothetical protein ACXWJZ_01460 [Burkholderiaceae bacterium]